MTIRHMLFAATSIVAVASMPGAAQAATTTLSATFTKGAIAEYANNPNQSDNAVLFSTLDITSVVISQTTTTGLWGSQGNDVNVTVTVNRTSGAPLVFAGAINWVKKTNGQPNWIGITVDPSVADGFTLSSGFTGKTYILELDSSTAVATLHASDPDSLDGSADLNGAFGVLNDYYGADTTAPVVTSGQIFNYAENRTQNTTIGTVLATDAVGVTGFRFSANSSQTSADGYYTIDNSGVIKITAAGVAAGVENNDYEIGSNTFTYGVQAVDAAGNWSAAATVTLNVTNLDDVAPKISGPSGAAGAAESAITVNENQTGVTKVTADETSTWAIVGGTDSSKFDIAADGTITFKAAPDYEGPTDSNTNNVYELIVEATDAAGNKSTQKILVTVANLDDTGPKITGPSGAAGAAESAITVNENQTGVTKVTADETSTWAIVGGVDSGKFDIAADGTITFKSAPDYEGPTDSNTNNVYELIVEATDTDGNKSTQKVLVTVANLDDTGPKITGPSGAAGAAESAITVNENQTGVTKVTADETSTWAIVGGVDSGKFDIAADGTITFKSAPDYEGPTDSNTNNTYELIVEATDAAGNKTTQKIVVTVANLDDTAPKITGPTGSAGAAESAITVNENQTAVTKVTADESVTWAITGGTDSGKFDIAVDGTITFKVAPDYEVPTDSNTNNVYELIVEATDSSGNKSVQTVRVTVADIDDTKALITGPSGAPGADASAITVRENQTGVTKVTANETVTWAISGGADSAKFNIAADGTITFKVAPDYELPTDADGNNVYVIIVRATDGAGNISYQTISITVSDIDDTKPLITGPSGGAGAETSAITVKEGQTGVTKVTANETVTWAISGGADSGKFDIAADGTITFKVAPDYENPTDADGNNVYVIVVRATDAAGNISYQTISITVSNVDEIAAKLAEIGGRLRADLRNYAFNSLQDSLAFNEGMMQDSADDDASCGAGSAKKATSGSMQANEAQQNINLKYAQQLNACNARIRVLLDMGLAVTNRAGNTTVRTLASIRGERKLGNDVTLGLGVMGSWASDKLQSFATSHISDKAYQANAYMRVKLAPELRMGAFASFGHASYNFDLADGGMSLTGKMGGNRVAFGGMLTGDFNLAGLGVSTDVALSHASESLKNATLAAQYRGESRTGIAFAVGTVDATRLSVPFHFGLIGKANAKGESGGNLLTISPGLLCEDANADATGLTCGFQVGGRYKQKLSQRDRISLEARFEKVAGIERSIFSLGFGHSFGPLEMLMAVNQEMTRFAQDSRAMLSLRLLNR